MKNILIVKLGAAGDVVRTTSFLPGLKKKYGKVAIDWLTERHMEVLLAGNPYLRTIFFIDEPAAWQDHRYDLVINLDADYEVCRIIGTVPHGKLIGTYAHEGKIAYTPDSAMWFDMSLLSRHGKERADLLKIKNRRSYQDMWHEIMGLPGSTARPQFLLDKHDHTLARAFAKSHRIKPSDTIIGLNTGAGNKWIHKKLSIPQTTAILKRLHHKYPKAKFLIIGGPTEARRNARIAQAVPQAYNATARSIKELGAIIHLCSTVVTSDSLPLHIATALEKKVVAFFAPTSPWEIELYDQGHKVLPTTPCLACYHRQCPVAPKFDLDEIVRYV